MDIDFNEAKRYIAEKFRKQADFDFIPPKERGAIVDMLVGIDSEYMLKVMENDIYDEDFIYNKMFEAVSEKYGKYKTYLMRFVDDYMDFMEQYLALIDAVEWIDD